MARRPERGSPSLFFESFREALSDAPAGLVRAADPAPPQALAAAEEALGASIPHAYAEFLRSFDGADLFHEAIVLCGVGSESFRSLVEANTESAALRGNPAEIVFAEGADGDRFLLVPDDAGENRVLRVRGDAEERWLVGSSFPRWLDATLARGLLLYDRDGEFLLDAFEEDGEELTPTFALRQAERGVKRDPEGAQHHHDLALALRRLGRMDRAAEAFAAAAELDPANPWLWFDLGRTRLAAGADEEAVKAFTRAAEATAGPEGARFLTWASRAALEAGRFTEAERLKVEAEKRDPTLPAQIQRAAEAAAAEGNDEARSEAESLAAVFANRVPARHRLPVLAPPKEAPPAAPPASPRPPSPRPTARTRPPVTPTTAPQRPAGTRPPRRTDRPSPAREAPPRPGASRRGPRR